MRFWISYLFLIRKFYSRNWNGQNSSSFALAVFCIFSILLFILSLLEYLGDYYLIRQFFGTGIPLAPIAMVFAFIFFTICSMLFNKEYNAARIKTIRDCKIAVAHIKRSCVRLFIIISIVMLPSSIILQILMR